MEIKNVAKPVNMAAGTVTVNHCASIAKNGNFLSFGVPDINRI